MIHRVLSLAVLAALVLVFGGLAQAADKEKDTKDDKNTHVGTFVSAKAQEFTMKDKDGKEHSHTLAKGAQVLDADGKKCKITDLKKGQSIKVTTKEGDSKVATKVEVVKKK